MDAVEKLYETLVKTTLLMDDSNNRFFQKFNLGNTRFYALVHVHAAPGISLSDLSTRLFCTKGNTTRIMKSLENDGLLVRETNQEDNRALRLTLTEKGAALLHEAALAHQEFNKKRFGCLNAIEKGSLQQNLDTLNAYLETVIQTL